MHEVLNKYWKIQRNSDSSSSCNREEKYKTQMIGMREEITSLKSQLLKEQKKQTEADKFEFKIFEQEKQINNLQAEKNKLSRELRVLKYITDKNKKFNDKQNTFQNESENVLERKIIIDIDGKETDNCSVNKCSRSNSNNCPLENLKVAVIGGLDRLEGKYKNIIESMGGEFMFHKGKCNGEVVRLKNIVCRSDIVVFITSVNSHNAMHIVKGTCNKNGKTFCVMRETSPGRLREFLINNLPRKKLCLQH